MNEVLMRNDDLNELEMAAWEMIHLGDKTLDTASPKAQEVREFFAFKGVVPYLPSLRPFFSHTKIIFLMHTLQLAFGGHARQQENGNIEIKMCAKLTEENLHISSQTQRTLRKFFAEQGIFESRYSRKEGVFLITLNPVILQEFMHRLAKISLPKAPVQALPLSPKEVPVLPKSTQPLP